MKIEFEHNFGNGILVKGFFDPEKLLSQLWVDAHNCFGGEKGKALIEKSQSLQACIKTDTGYITIKPVVRAFVWDI
jgi:hypothetical protein